MSYEKGTTIHRSTIELLDKLDKYLKQRDQYKAERDTLNDKLNQAYEDNYRLEGQLHDVTKRHGKLIYDIAVLKTNISRLERENHDFKKRNALLMNTVDDLDKENKALRLQANTYIDEWQNTKALGYETYNEAVKYKTLTDHIRLKAECNPGIWRYIDLVNYIDRLERD